MALAPSSPRLPSPPPAVEIQIGPNSPGGGPAATLATTEMEQSHLDANSRRRIHPGTKSADMAAGPPLVPLNELDSPFQLQEHLAALHYHHTASGTQALTRAAAYQLAQPPPGIDRTLWLYELCRFLISQCNSLIVGFLFDTPPCSASTCPEMRASEWQFLCAVHEQPKSCCAIDYCCHTLDWAANVVCDQKIFPSRFVVVNDAHSKNVGVKSLVNVFRRLHRIFAHAWFQHRSVFWSVEGQTGLYVFFKGVCDLYDLLPAENYKLPPEAEGLDAPLAEPDIEKPPPTILKPPTQSPVTGLGDDNLHASVGRTNTRRHIRSSPSTGSAVTTVIEADEEEGDGVSRRLKNMHLTAPSPVTEEAEAVDVPVIVEHPTSNESPAPQPPAESKVPNAEESEAEKSDIPDDETVIETEPEPESDPTKESFDNTEETKEPAESSHTAAEPEPNEEEPEKSPDPTDVAAKDEDPSPEVVTEAPVALAAATEESTSAEDTAEPETATHLETEGESTK